MPLRLASILLCCSLLFTACRHVEPKRFPADARINDKPARLAYDTGAEATLVFSRRVKSLGLKVAEPAQGTPSSGKVILGRTGFCDFKVGADKYHLKMHTLHVPWWWPLDIDGLIGWPYVQDDLLVIDAATASIRSLDHLPEGIEGWSKFRLYQHTGVLALEVPRADGKTGVLEVDTGNSDGVSLSMERWMKWRKSDPRARWKWTVTFMPGSFGFFYRQYTADELALGPLTLKNVPVRKMNRTEKALAADGDVMEGSLGFKALEQLNVIVDQKNHVAYLRARPVATATNESAGGKIAQPKIAKAPSTVHLRFREQEIIDRAEDDYTAGKYVEAMAAYTRYLEMEPEDAWGHWRCGSAGYLAAASQGKTDDYARAAAELTRVLQLQSGFTAAWLLRGNVAYATHQWSDALQAYRKVCEMDPQHADYARIYIWMIRTQNGERVAADQELHAFYQSGGNFVGEPWEAKVAALLLGNLGEAQFLRAAGSDTGRQCEAWFYAGLRHRLAGEQNIAQEYFRKCIATARTDYFEYGFAVGELKTAQSASAN